MRLCKEHRLYVVAETDATSQGDEIMMRGKFSKTFDRMGISHHICKTLFLTSRVTFTKNNCISYSIFEIGTKYY